MHRMMKPLILGAASAVALTLSPIAFGTLRPDGDERGVAAWRVLASPAPFRLPPYGALLRAHSA